MAYFRRFVFFAVLVVGLCASGVLTAAEEPKSEAAAYYLSGLDALNKGDLDTAITELRQALQLKPDSVLSKDKLIEALGRKVDALQNQLRALSGTVPSEPSKPAAVTMTSPEVTPPAGNFRVVPSGGVPPAAAPNGKCPAKWELRSADGGHIRGSLRNTSAKPIGSASIKFRTFNAFGHLLGTAFATVSALAPGESREFDVLVSSSISSVRGIAITCDGSMWAMPPPTPVAVKLGTGIRAPVRPAAVQPVSP